MRDLREHSIDENIQYLKEHEKSLYDTLKFLARNAVYMYDTNKDKIDSGEKFDDLLKMFKRNLLGAIQMKFTGDKLSRPEILTDNNIHPTVDIFEYMFLNGVERIEFDSLDPEVQELYLEAQRIIDKEENSD